MLICICGGQRQVQLSNISLWQHPVMVIISTGAGDSWFVYLFANSVVVFGKDVGAGALDLGLVLNDAVETVRWWEGFGYLRC